jgi:V-type H+-transporting ATPase subunit C
VKLDDEHEH